jgi:phosphoribosylformylglycinamidine cyclo-ligase
MDKKKKTKETGMTYAESGVDIDRADKAIVRIKKLIHSTFTDGVPTGIGGFAGFFRPNLEGMSKPILVSSTDGVGTKLLIAQKMKKLDTIGIDLVAMVVNDIVCVGAKPLFLLDYIGIGKFDDDTFESVIKGIVDGCKNAGCALIGGETAELPDMYPAGEFDLAAFGVGIVDESKIIDGSQIREGDVIVGLQSSGFHSNGYSFVRKVVADKSPYDYPDIVPELGIPLGDALLKPTTIYVNAVMNLLEAGIGIHGIANITGGGITGNIPRILPSTVNARIDPSTWEVPAEMQKIIEWGNVSFEEKYKSFNMGIGMVLVMTPCDVEQTMQVLKPYTGVLIGEIVPGRGKVILTEVM